MATDMKYGQVEIEGIPDDEPVFILRAQDALSVPAIARYQVLAIEAELPQNFINALNEVLAGFMQWQTDNAEAVKKPD